MFILLIGTRILNIILLVKKLFSVLSYRANIQLNKNIDICTFFIYVHKKCTIENNVHNIRH